MTKKRFKEIVSTQKIIDTVTNKEYDCLLDNDLFDLINVIAEENKQSEKKINWIKKQLDRVCIENEELGDKLEKIRGLCYD